MKSKSRTKAKVAKNNNNEWCESTILLDPRYQPVVRLFRLPYLWKRITVDLVPLPFDLVQHHLQRRNEALQKIQVPEKSDIEVANDDRAKDSQSTTTTKTPNSKAARLQTNRRHIGRFCKKLPAKKFAHPKKKLNRKRLIRPRPFTSNVYPETKYLTRHQIIALEAAIEKTTQNSNDENDKKEDTNVESEKDKAKSETEKGEDEAKAKPSKSSSEKPTEPAVLDPSLIAIENDEEFPTANAKPLGTDNVFKMFFKSPENESESQPNAIKPVHRSRKWRCN